MVSAARALAESRARRGAMAVATTWAGRVATEGFGSRQASPYQFADVALSLDARKTWARAQAGRDIRRSRSTACCRSSRGFTTHSGFCCSRVSPSRFWWASAPTCCSAGSGRARAAGGRDGRRCSRTRSAPSWWRSTLGIEPWPGQLPYGAEQAREYHRQDAAYATLAGLQGDARIWFAANFVVRGFPPRLATVHGVRSFQDAEALYLARQRDYLTFLFGGRGSPLDWIRVDTKELVSRARLLDLASVRYVVVPY